MSQTFFNKLDKKHFQKDGFKLKRKSLNTQPQKSLYVFEKYDDIYDFCKTINIKELGSNTLYKLNDEFYLEIEATNLNHILDFAVPVKNSDILMGKINEYGKIIIEDNALQEIGKSFIKKKKVKSN